MTAQPCRQCNRAALLCDDGRCVECANDARYNNPEAVELHAQLIYSRRGHFDRRWTCAAADGAWRAYQHPVKGLNVIESIEPHDGQWWQHVSFARGKEPPPYEVLQFVRGQFIGDSAESYMVFPPRSRYVNLHPGVLHLWRCLSVPDGVVLPRFEMTLQNGLRLV
jgi:hypothetical protein